MTKLGYPYNDLVICKDSTDYLCVTWQMIVSFFANSRGLIFIFQATQIPQCEASNKSANLEMDEEGEERKSKTLHEK